jgi:hypothetical protein
LPQPRQVHRDAAEAAGERRYDLRPREPRAAPVVDKHQSTGARASCRGTSSSKRNGKRRSPPRRDTFGAARRPAEACDGAPNIVSQNIRRRHLNAGQRAILLALAYPEPKRGMHSELKFSTEVDKGDLSRARAICKWAPRPADGAAGGALTARKYMLVARGFADKFRWGGVMSSPQEQNTTIGDLILRKSTRSPPDVRICPLDSRFFTHCAACAFCPRHGTRRSLVLIAGGLQWITA